MVSDQPESRKRGMRWGLLTLLFLGIALVCVMVSNANGEYGPLTLLGLLVGLGGAGYSSYRGLKGFSWLPR
jgi:nitrate/nitrite transporter NarK